jgi:hypothetical protein
MLYREIIAVCYQIQGNHKNNACRQKVEMLNVELVIHKCVVINGL